MAGLSRMMFGNFPDDWTAPSPLTGELIVYVILYFIVVFLLMQNFLLAIIVEVSAPPLLSCSRACNAAFSPSLALRVDRLDIKGCSLTSRRFSCFRRSYCTCCVCVCVCVRARALVCVQAYMKVAQANEEMETEQDFFSDLYGCVNSKVQGIKNGTHMNAGCSLNPTCVALSNAA